MSNLNSTDVSKYILKVLYYQFGGENRSIMGTSYKILSQYTHAECGIKDISTSIQKLLDMNLIDTKADSDCASTCELEYRITEHGIVFIETDEQLK